MISQPIRLSTNFMTLILSLTFTELEAVSLEHLQRMWNASRKCQPLHPLVPSPYWDLRMLLFSRTCRVFSRFINLNTPRYFFDFAFQRLNVNSDFCEVSFRKKIHILVSYTPVFLRDVLWYGDICPSVRVSIRHSLPHFSTPYFDILS